MYCSGVLWLTAGNPRAYKALRNELIDVTEELRRVGDSIDIGEEFWLHIRMALEIVAGMREEVQ